MVNNITISKADICDLNNIDKLENSLEHRILSKISLEQNISNTSSYVLVAKKGNETIAYASVSYLIDHIDIDSIVVDNNFRNQGVASYMLKHIFKLASELNIADIFLEVRVSNTPAIKLYDKNGFKKIHIRKNYYPDNLEDAFVYKKELA